MLKSVVNMSTVTIQKPAVVFKFQMFFDQKSTFLSSFRCYCILSYVGQQQSLVLMLLGWVRWKWGCAWRASSVLHGCGALVVPVVRFVSVWLEGVTFKDWSHAHFCGSPGRCLYLKKLKKSSNRGTILFLSWLNIFDRIYKPTSLD